MLRLIRIFRLLKSPKMRNCVDMPLGRGGRFWGGFGAVLGRLGSGFSRRNSPVVVKGALNTKKIVGPILRRRSFFGARVRVPWRAHFGPLTSVLDGECIRHFEGDSHELPCR